MNKAERAQALRSSEWCMLVFSFCIGSRHLLCVRFSVLWWVTTAHVLAFRFLLVFFVSRHLFSFSFYFLGLLRRSRIKQNSENVLAYKIFIKPQWTKSSASRPFCIRYEILWSPSIQSYRVIFGDSSGKLCVCVLCAFWIGRQAPTDEWIETKVLQHPYWRLLLNSFSGGGVHHHRNLIGCLQISTKWW